MQACSQSADIPKVRTVSKLTILLASVLLFALSATLAQADPRSECPGADANYSEANLAALRTTVICLTNRERVARGMAPLSEESHLDAAAQGHSEDMAQNNYFDHTDLNGGKPWDRTKAAGYTNEWIGENIAAGYSSSFQVMTGWMKSSGHCANILNSPYVEIGIGVAKVAGSKYGTYWTMVLGGHNSSAATVKVTCPTAGLTDGAVPVTKPAPPTASAPPKVTITLLKRRAGGRYRVEGTITPAAKGVRVKITLKRGKKSRRYSVKTTATGAFAKTLRPPGGAGKLNVSAVAGK